MPNPGAATGFVASLLIQGMGVAASVLVGKVAQDRLEAKQSRLKSPPPSNFGADTVRAHLAWGIDAVTAIATLVGPMVAFVLLLPSLGVQGATLLNLAAILVSFAMFVAVLVQDDPVKWVGTYRARKTLSPVTIAGAIAYTILGIAAYLLA